MLEELWQPVEDFPNYEISNFGRVVNINTGRELKPTKVGTDGRYLKIKLWNNGMYRWFNLHRLVAREFFLQYSDNIEVSCKNGNYHDCTVANITLRLHESGRRRGAYLHGETLGFENKFLDEVESPDA